MLRHNYISDPGRLGSAAVEQEERLAQAHEDYVERSLLDLIHDAEEREEFIAAEGVRGWHDEDSVVGKLIALSAQYAYGTLKAQDMADGIRSVLWSHFQKQAEAKITTYNME
jgi:hypothetical protein